MRRREVLHKQMTGGRLDCRWPDIVRPNASVKTQASAQPKRPNACKTKYKRVSVLGIQRVQGVGKQRIEESLATHLGVDHDIHHLRERRWPPRSPPNANPRTDVRHDPASRL